jgi:Spy/CpxP family protein refolding chaperone
MERSLFLHGIALTAEQEDQVFKLTHAEIPKMRDHMKQEQQLKQELSALTQASSFDENKAKQIADKLANLTRERAFSRAKLDSQVFALLTPAQREQATKNKEKMTKDRDGIQPTRFHHRHSHQHHPTNS